MSTSLTLVPTTRFSGSVRVPPDKSLTHRALLLSALADGVSTVEHPLKAEDCLSTAACLEVLGCRIEKTGDRWTVHGVGLRGFRAPSSPLDCGNSGTTMRLLSGILAAQPFVSEMIGDASLSRRPMDRVAAPLRKMGATIELKDGKYATPFRIHGAASIKPISWTNPVASAQVKSCVLLAALHAKGKTTFTEPSLSRDHTERMLKACGVTMTSTGPRPAIATVRGPARLAPQAWSIPSDISSAAFFLVAGLVVPGGRVVIEAVNVNPTRTGILDVLEAAGVSVGRSGQHDVGGEPVADLVVEHQRDFRPLSVDIGLAPRLIDEVPVLAVAATQAQGTSVFSGIEELRVKETDRLKALAVNLTAMGARVEEKPDGLVIHGPTPLHGASVDSFGDHRIAMAFAVASLIAKGPTEIRNPEAVSISFPEFWSLLERLTHP